MKVLEITPGFTGGIATHIHNIVKGINRNNITIDVMGFDADIGSAEKFCKDIEKKRGKVISIKSPKEIGILNFILKIRTIIRDNGPYDLVHIHMHGHRLVCFSLAARLAGVKRIASHAHIASEKNESTIKNRIRHQIEQVMTRLAANQYISCSKLASDYVYGKKMTSKVMHIPNSIDPDEFIAASQKGNREMLMSEVGVDINTILIVHVGYFGYQKNHPFMVELIELMVKSKINFKWLFVGVGEGMDSIKQSICKKGLDDYVAFMGYRKDIPSILANSDVMVLPSIFEGLPTVAIESQAAGTPCILSTNVSTESDMGIGICSFVALSDKDKWVHEIIRCSKIKVDCKDAITVLKKKRFTNESAADLYADYIEGKIDTYML